MQTTNNISQGSLCAIGVIGKAFGLNGEVNYHSFLRTSKDYPKSSKFLVGLNEETLRTLTLTSVNQHSKNLLVKFSEISSRTEAEAIVNNFLFVSMDERKELPKGSIYIHDIIGFTVVNESKEILGEVIDVVNLPGHQAYVVKSGIEEVYVPVVKEIVKSVNIEMKKIIISPPDGMFNGAAIWVYTLILLPVYRSF